MRFIIGQRPHLVGFRTPLNRKQQTNKVITKSLVSLRGSKVDVPKSLKIFVTTNSVNPPHTITVNHLSALLMIISRNLQVPSSEGGGQGCRSLIGLLLQFTTLILWKQTLWSFISCIFFYMSLINDEKQKTIKKVLSSLKV